MPRRIPFARRSAQGKKLFIISQIQLRIYTAKTNAAVDAKRATFIHTIRNRVLLVCVASGDGGVATPYVGWFGNGKTFYYIFFIRRKKSQTALLASHGIRTINFCRQNEIEK